MDCGSGVEELERDLPRQAGARRAPPRAAAAADLRVARPVSAQPKANVLCLIGTRPEAIKMLPVVLALRASANFVPIVVTTGQHRDLVDPILALADITPDFDLEVGHPGLTLNELVSTVISRLDGFLPRAVRRDRRRDRDP